MAHKSVKLGACQASKERPFPEKTHTKSEDAVGEFLKIISRESQAPNPKN